MSDVIICPSCGVFLEEPYIRCVECKDPPRSFCLPCFAKGKEYDNHLNNHCYEIMRSNFTIIDCSWTAAEELLLLNAILDCGFGNWSDVAKFVGTKKREECEEHYLKCYIHEPKSPLPKIPEPDIVNGSHATPIPYRICHDPPRPAAGSSLFFEMAGYNAARSDFATEYDDYAELDVKDTEFTKNDDPLWKELQLAILSIYQTRLKERCKRKTLIKRYGLISMKQNIEYWRRYDILGKARQERFKALMRLVPPMEYDKFLEGQLYEERLKQRIKLLQECHDAGIIKLHDIGIYIKMKKAKESRRRMKTPLDEVLNHVKDEISCQQYVRKRAFKDNVNPCIPDSVPASGRRQAPPLDITGLPGYDKLSMKEKELCAVLRLLPESFLQYKSTLINECRKIGSLRLANARNVIKIDVNKTRKIYDLLLDEGLISKGS